MDICKVYKIILMLSNYVFQNGFFVDLDPDSSPDPKLNFLPAGSVSVTTSFGSATILWIKWKIRKNVPGLFVILPINDN